MSCNGLKWFRIAHDVLRCSKVNVYSSSELGESAGCSEYDNTEHQADITFICERTIHMASKNWCKSVY